MVGGDVYFYNAGLDGQLEFIAYHVKYLHDHCKKLLIPISTVQKLHADVVSILNQNHSENKNLKSLVKLLEKYYNAELQQYKRPLLLFFKPKTINEIIKKINENPNRYHFSRILALMLQHLYLSNEDFPQTAIADVYKIKTPESTIYNELFPPKKSVLENPEYQTISILLQKLGFTNTEIYNMYRHQHILDAKVAKRLWPQLAEAGGLLLLEKEIDLLLEMGVTDRLIAIATNNKDYLQNTIQIALPCETDRFKREEAYRRSIQEVTDLLNKISEQVTEIKDYQDQLRNIQPGFSSRKRLEHV